jgi:hypothetical protein
LSQNYAGSPDTANQPIRDPAWEDPINRPQPRRAPAPRATTVPANAWQKIQAISVAVIAAILLLVVLLAGFQALKARALMQQYQQNCGVNPSTGLVECR